MKAVVVYKLGVSAKVFQITVNNIPEGSDALNIRALVDSAIVAKHAAISARKPPIIHEGVNLSLLPVIPKVKSIFIPKSN